MPNDNESTEKLLALLTERVSSLERIVALQHAENGRLFVAIQGHQVTIEAFAKLLGIELQPAQPPTASN